MSAGFEIGRGGNERPGAEDDAEWDGLKGEVGGIADAAVEQGKQFFGAAKEQAATYADRRKDEAADTVSEFAASLRSATRTFDDRPNIRAFVDGAAGGLDDLAETIRDRSFDEIFAEIEDVIRQRPLTVAATSLALGFLAARFIKSSADNLREGSERREFARRAASSSGERRPRAPASDEA